MKEARGALERSASLLIAIRTPKHLPDSIWIGLRSISRSRTWISSIWKTRAGRSSHPAAKYSSPWTATPYWAPAR